MLVIITDTDVSKLGYSAEFDYIATLLFFERFTNLVV